MDFGSLGLDGWVGSDSDSHSHLNPLSLSSPDPTPQTNQNPPPGSGSTFFIKQDKPLLTTEHERDHDRDFGNKATPSKLIQTSSTHDLSTIMLHLQSNGNAGSDGLVRSGDNSFGSSWCDQNQHMLCFSSPKLNNNIHNAGLSPYFSHTSASQNKYLGGNSDGLNGVNVHGAWARGSFTPSQWMELQHQAMIYKYIALNAPVPSHLLMPIKKAFDSAGYTCYSGGLIRTNAFGCGSFNLAFSNSTDPEPGRCRRTDGKKWRCSKDAVADQKYCERHMNRGRHRSRKPVEGQTGHSVSGATAATKLMPVTSTSASVLPGSSSSNNLTMSPKQLQSFQPGVSNLSASTAITRMFMNQEANNKEPDLSIIMKQSFPHEGSCGSEFGLISSGSIPDPARKTSSLMNFSVFGSSLDFGSSENEPRHSIHRFIDELPENHSDHAVGSWSELDVQFYKTQLSIAIPMASSDYMSSTSSPETRKANLSDMKSLHESDKMHMNIGMGSLDEQGHKPSNWIPISWETSVGGPLGEVLQRTNSSTMEHTNSSMLNLMTDGWENSSSIGSSPTGVLQKSAFASLSNSSSGGSPSADINRALEGPLVNDLAGSSIVDVSCLAAM